MEAVIAVLALIGLVSLVGVGIRWCEEPAPPVEADLAAPYREGLHAAVRMQSAAQDLERQIYEEAARHAALPAVVRRDA
jgi:hypothetical protein